MGWIFVSGAVAAVLLFFVLRKAATLWVERKISAYQQDLLMKHFDEVRQAYAQIRGWRHDYHNHIQTMKALLALGNTDEHEQYLHRLDEDLREVDALFKTGNVMVDAILNSKISLARAKGIRVTAKAAVPQNIAVSEIDLCVILGNLLDNAIEAGLNCPEENRFIRLYIGRHKDMLYLSVSNSSPPVRRGFLSTKRSASHGFGLMRLDRVTAKNKGFVNRQFEEGVFATEIMLPM